MAYVEMGEYQEAEKHYWTALEIGKEIYGEKHTEIATVYNNLGLLYDHKGEYQKSKELYLRSLDLKQTILGKEHPDVANICINLALVDRKLGNHEIAT